MDTQKLYTVKNRSASRVCYTIPEDGIRRAFAPGESKQISYQELLKLSYQPGGREMMVAFLQITDEGALANFNIHAQPEYFMTEEQIIDLLVNGSQEAFLDCLDFAPIGVIDLIKKYAVSLPLQDYNKRQALKEKTGFDVDKAVENEKLDKEPEPVNEGTATSAPASASTTTGTTTRRTNANYKVATKNTEEKETTSGYKVVNKT